jgi:uncharacterized protein with PIN domain
MTETTFVADVMVGKLARWLRVLGFDVLYSNKYVDDELIRISESQTRVVLTRDTGLAARLTRGRCLFIESDDYKEQVRQVVHSCGLQEFKVFSRCLECNASLVDVDKETIFDKVPPFVYLTQERFVRCPSCDRVYWHGTHAEHMLRQILPNDDK